MYFIWKIRVRFFGKMMVIKYFVGLLCVYIIFLKLKILEEISCVLLLIIVFCVYKFLVLVLYDLVNVLIFNFFNMDIFILYFLWICNCGEGRDFFFILFCFWNYIL